MLRVCCSQVSGPLPPGTDPHGSEQGCWTWHSTLEQRPWLDGHLTGRARSRAQTSVGREAGQASIRALPGGGADSRDGDFPTAGKGAQRGPRARASSVHLTGRLSLGRHLPVTQYCLTRGRPPHRTVTQGEMTLRIWSLVLQGLVPSKSAACE